MRAYDEDVRCYASGRPAVSKLKMRREVESTLVKVGYREALLNMGLLRVFKIWLEPMTDGTLVSEQIGKPFSKSWVPFASVKTSWISFRNRAALVVWSTSCRAMRKAFLTAARLRKLSGNWHVQYGVWQQRRLHSSSSVTGAGLWGA